MPVFEGLLPPKHEEIVQTLIFRLAEWHMLAKLRLHIDDTLALLDQALRWLGVQLRRFRRVTCATFETKELCTSRVRSKAEKGTCRDAIRPQEEASEKFPSSQILQHQHVQASRAWRLQPDDKDILHY